LIIVQNLPVPLDRRVWLECQALRRAGASVSVICPKGPDDPSRQTIDGVDIYKYRPAPQADGVVGYLVEFVYSWVRTAVLSVVVWRRGRFDVIQACNPPDTYWALARWWRLRGVKFVFDQHDLNPELFLSRFGSPRTLAERLQYRGLLWLERMTYRTADHVIATNESYRRIALERGGRRADEVTVVRSGPDTERMRPVYPPASIRRDADHLLAYIGIMGPQDGVDGILDVMDELVHRRGRTGVHAVLMGFGDCLDGLRERCSELGLDGNVRFTGRVGPEAIADHLSAADVGLSPDLKTPLNDVSTMNKTMEYMAYCVPSVSYDLDETRVSAADTALFVESGDVVGFADAVERLLDDDELRVAMGLGARRRVVEHLDWRQQARAYVGVFDRLLGAVDAAQPSTRSTIPTGSDAPPAPIAGDRLLVPLDDDAELRRFVLRRHGAEDARGLGEARSGEAGSDEPVPAGATDR
jgi:glycosyltransferase involved in cell wall biosynthesis